MQQTIDAPDTDLSRIAADANYVIFDPDQLLGDEVLRVYRLDGLAFHRVDEPVWFPDVGLGLRIWKGQYEDHENTWLRWCDAQGGLVPTGKERADTERERADTERERANRLTEQLRQLGVEPQR